MQRRLLGFVLGRIHEAQDFLAECCYADARGIISEEKKSRLVCVTDALAPWVQVLATVLSDHSAFLEKLNEIATSTRSESAAGPEPGFDVFLSHTKRHE